MISVYGNCQSKEIVLILLMSKNFKYVIKY